MAVAVLPSSLTPDVLHGNHSFDIPSDVYDEQVLPLLKELEKIGIIDPSSIKFEPSKHIEFTDEYFQTTKRITLEELGVENPHQTPISPIGVSHPFPLFTEEAVLIMRWEMFQKDTFLKCARVADHSNTGDLDMYLRGFVKDYAPFTYQAWNHPRTMEIISKMAGVELEHMFDYEIANSNISIRNNQTKILDESKDEYEDPNDIPAILSWHFDSPQFVCVLMMSPTDDMIGGETSLTRGDGKVVKVENPKRGWANVLQGRILKHVAPKPRGSYSERITQVCSYRPSDPMKDNCAATTIKPSQLAGTRYNEFYKDWMNYRLDVLNDRIKVLQDQINTTTAKGETFSQIETINFIQNNIVEYAEHSWQEFEVVDDGLVQKPASYKVTQARWD